MRYKRAKRPVPWRVMGRWIRKKPIPETGSIQESKRHRILDPGSGKTAKREERRIDLRPVRYFSLWWLGFQPGLVRVKWTRDISVLPSSACVYWFVFASCASPSWINNYAVSKTMYEQQGGKGTYRLPETFWKRKIKQQWKDIKNFRCKTTYPVLGNNVSLTTNQLCGICIIVYWGTVSYNTT